MIVLLSGLTACTPALPLPFMQTATPTALPASPTPVPATATSTPAPTDTAPAPTIAATPTLGLDAWMFMPVVPAFSDTAIEIYKRGLAMGRDPHRFSKAGDCESTTGWYLSDFDRGPAAYTLGEYESLKPTIAYYSGSFGRESLAVRRGANTASLLTTLWADPAQCQPGESMLACEYRVFNPSLVIIAIGSNDKVGIETFEMQMRRIIEYTISQGIVPILATKADNAEGGHKLNTIIGTLSYEYDIPLWNFWWAVQPLPNHGLDTDGYHLTFASNDFSDPNNMRMAWPWRNLTALQTLDAARQALEKITP